MSFDFRKLILIYACVVIGLAALGMLQVLVSATGMGLAARVLLAVLLITVISGVAARLVVERRLSLVELEMPYRDFLRGPRPTDPLMFQVWKLGRLAQWTWIVALVVVVTIGFGVGAGWVK
jgi:hypothetical protein